MLITEVGYRGSSKICQVDKADCRAKVGSEKIWLTLSYLGWRELSVFSTGEFNLPGIE